MHAIIIPGDVVRISQLFFQRFSEKPGKQVKIGNVVSHRDYDSTDCLYKNTNLYGLVWEILH